MFDLGVPDCVIFTVLYDEFVVMFDYVLFCFSLRLFGFIWFTCVFVVYGYWFWLIYLDVIVVLIDSGCLLDVGCFEIVF